jgi:hypothetical protein
MKIYTAKSAHAATCIKRLSHIFLNEPLLRGHLSYKDNFSLSQRWPLNTGLTALAKIW